MSLWTDLGALFTRASNRAFSGVVEAVRTVFEGDPETRRRVAFSIAMIALSAKMAKADGVVTQDEIRAFQQIFHVPEGERRNVSRLYDLAKRDVAGYEVYARQMTNLCGSGEPGCPVMEDILDGLFHIAKADGVVHESEMDFLERVSTIFGFDEHGFRRISSRHVDLGESDPYTVLGLRRGATFAEVRARYRDLVRENHPDRLVARGVPEEFIVIAHDRMAAINAAYAAIEKEFAAA
ncbi:MAG: DnaJ family molecular chaperone [Zhengella sp.]|uniref:TerB family tellurite resistance protein n=1 Tax=Zhengella sp. TaxID=2282762 RepID=UPI001D212EBA|nr:DnaJ family molecular chaperone [Notoacmeibacter sp.]MCC0026938.1 DnaJ family molecular chaperone [Brucellaceae bacterium]